METLQSILDSEHYQTFRAETLLNPQFHMINDTGVDVDLMLELQKNGSFGVAHASVIENWRDYLETCGDFTGDELVLIQAEIDAKEQYHIKARTIDNFI